MFEKKKLTLLQAKIMLETIYYPRLLDHLRELSIQAMVLAAGDESELYFLDTLGELQTELNLLQRLDLDVFLTRAIHIESTISHKKWKWESIKISLDRVAKKRKKILRLTGELNKICNDFVVKRDWAESKRLTCKSLFEFYQSLLTFMNFHELSVLPVILEKFGIKEIELSE